jgi:hypothetical protein
VSSANEKQDARESFTLEFKRTVSRARKTEGWKVCTLIVDGKRVARCNGGGYDKEGTVLGLWIAGRFPDELREKVTRPMYGLTFHDPEFDPGKAVVPGTGTTVEAMENAKESFGLERYKAIFAASSPVPTEKHRIPHLDGGCGKKSMVAVLQAIGGEFREIVSRKNGSVAVVSVPRALKHANEEALPQAGPDQVKEEPGRYTGYERNYETLLDLLGKEGRDYRLLEHEDKPLVVQKLDGNLVSLCQYGRHLYGELAKAPEVRFLVQNREAKPISYTNELDRGGIEFSTVEGHCGNVPVQPWLQESLDSRVADWLQEIREGYLERAENLHADRAKASGLHEGQTPTTSERSEAMSENTQGMSSEEAPRSWKVGIRRDANHSWSYNSARFKTQADAEVYRDGAAAIWAGGVREWGVHGATEEPTTRSAKEELAKMGEIRGYLYGLVAALKEHRNVEATRYVGTRTEEGCEVVKVAEGQDPKPLEPRLDLFNHSPRGFDWGSRGSGPAQTALAILADAARDDRLALALHQDFKEDFIARADEKGFEISGKQVWEWVLEHRRTVDHSGKPIWEWVLERQRTVDHAKGSAGGAEVREEAQAAVPAAKGPRAERAKTAGPKEQLPATKERSTTTPAAQSSPESSEAPAQKEAKLPLYELELGKLKAAVFHNQHARGDYHTVQLCRTFTGHDGKEKTGYAIPEQEIPQAMELLDEASRCIKAEQGQSKEESKKPEIQVTRNR